jgi:LysR family transcriptional regulator, transcription activator of glutamate synthase operon
MEIHQLQYIVEVAKQRNFTRAADAICVSQSTLSHQIAKLEDELGIKLFDRNSRMVYPTQAGEKFISHVRILLANLEFAKQDLQAYIGLLKGTLRIGVIASLGRIDYAGMLANFYKKYPGLNFEIVQDGTYRLLEKIGTGELDVAFVAMPVVSDYSEIDFYHLAYDDYILVIPEEHRFASRKSIDLAEASDEKFIFHPSSDRMHYICLDACLRAGFKPNIVCQSSHSPTCLALIHAGMGIGFFPQEKVRNQNFNITMIKLKQPIKKDIALAVSKRSSSVPAVKIFYQFVLDWVKNISTTGA